MPNEHPIMPRRRASLIRLAVAAAAGSAALRSPSTRLIAGEALLVDFSSYLGSETRATLARAGAAEIIYHAISAHPVFQAVVDGRQATGDGLRRNGLMFSFL